MLEWDADWSGRMRIAEERGLRRYLAIFLAHSGDSWFWLSGLILLWLLGSDYWKQRAMVLGGSILVTAVVVLAIKFTVRRRRPEGDWGSIYRSTDPHSFPSGHAARTILLATVTAGLGPVWLALILVVWAPLVALARVMMGLHYLSDVIVGAVLGLCIGLGIAIVVV